jgi:uncharacterized iron-regulated membrane protein
MLPHADDALTTDPNVVAAATARMMEGQPQSILYASQSFGLHRLSFAGGGGAYADQSGAMVTRWASQWERPELWLFDLHHHLLAGDTGETIIGIVSLCGLFFVISGVFLWWRTRATFSPRLLPRRMTVSAVRRHHRDLGIIAAPFLLVSLFTGATFVFRPVANLILGPGGAGAVTAALKPPELPQRRLNPQLDWRVLVQSAQARFPKAELRSLSIPRGKSNAIAVRLRQPSEWLPNGRTMAWFAPDTGHIVAARDARSLSPQVQAFNKFYPLHAAKVGGLTYRLLMTATGLALFLLGLLATWSFWFSRRRTGNANVNNVSAPLRSGA